MCFSSFQSDVVDLLTSMEMQSQAKRHKYELAQAVHNGVPINAAVTQSKKWMNNR